MLKATKDGKEIKEIRATKDSKAKSGQLVTLDSKVFRVTLGLMEHKGIRGIREIKVGKDLVLMVFKELKASKVLMELKAIKVQ